MEELSAKGAEFSGEPVDYGYGLMINLRIPAAGEVQLYQPSYRPSYDLPERRERSKLNYVSAMSTETSIVDFFASVKITPLTGGTSP